MFLIHPSLTRLELDLIESSIINVMKKASITNKDNN